MPSKAEALLMLHIQADERLRRWPWEREYRFGAVAAGGRGKGLRARLQAAGLRDWRFDFAVPELMLAVEVEGITHYGKTKTGKMAIGRHQSATGIEGDLQKYDAAMRLGWTVYRCSQHMVASGRAVETIAILVDQLAGKRSVARFLASAIKPGERPKFEKPIQFEES